MNRTSGNWKREGKYILLTFQTNNDFDYNAIFTLKEVKEALTETKFLSTRMDLITYNMLGHLILKENKLN